MVTADFLGAQYKKNKGIKDAASVGLTGVTNPKQLGAKDDSGTDFYPSATKILLGQSLSWTLTCVTPRRTSLAFSASAATKTTVTH